MDTPSRFRQRVDATLPKDSAAGFMFDSVLAHARKRLGPAHADPLIAAAGLPRRLIPLLKYPVQPLLKLMLSLTEASTAEAFEQELGAYGTALVEGFMLTSVGTTLLKLNAGNVHRLLKSAAIGYQSGMSFGTRSYEKISEREGKMTFQGELLGPCLQRAIVARGVELGSPDHAQVAVESDNALGTDFTLTVRW